MTTRPMARRDLLALAGVLSASAMAGAKGDSSSPDGGQAAPTGPARRAELYRLLGDLPDRQRPVSGRKIGEDERDGFTLEKWTLDLNGKEPVPAFVARPRGRT